MPEILVDPLASGADSAPAVALDGGGAMNSLDELVELAIEPTLEVALRAVLAAVTRERLSTGRVAVGELTARSSMTG